MNNPASAFLHRHQSAGLHGDELAHFLDLCVASADSAAQVEAFDYLLRAYELTTGQLTWLAESPVVRRSMAIRHGLQRYVRVRAYRAAEHASQDQASWLALLGLLASLPSG